MRMKLYYGASVLIWLLSGCAHSDETIKTVYKGSDNMGSRYGSSVIDNHEYINKARGIAHSGTCKQCKHELDSIVKNAVNEAIEATAKESWNE